MKSPNSNIFAFEILGHNNFITWNFPKEIKRNEITLKRFVKRKNRHRNFHFYCYNKFVEYLFYKDLPRKCKYKTLFSSLSSSLSLSDAQTVKNHPVATPIIISFAKWKFIAQKSGTCCFYRIVSSQLFAFENVVRQRCDSI